MHAYVTRQNINSAGKTTASVHTDTNGKTHFRATSAGTHAGGGLLQAERPPFMKQKAIFYNTKDRLLQNV